MPRWKVSYAQLAHDVVQQSAKPLTVDEIMAQVQAITPITTKNPKQTIRNAISQSQLIVSTGDGCYGWKLRLINASTLRHTLQEAELEQGVLYWDDDLWDALWPTFFAAEKYNDRSPVHVELPEGTVTQFTLEHFHHRTWGTHATPEFWAWFHELGAKPGDHLIVRVIDGEAKRYGVTFQARTERAEAAIAARNQEVVEVAMKLARRPYRATMWDITTHLLTTGGYRHPVPPDPISEIWDEDVWGPATLGDELTEVSVEPESLAKALFGWAVQENPLDLPREYDPDRGWRHTRASRKARTATVKSYVLRVNHRALPEVWRDIELAEDNTLEDLHLEIQNAYRWGDDHLYSFFLSGTRWDRGSEVGSPWSDTSLHTHHMFIEQLNLSERQSFLYLFDYGDNHEFDVAVLRINPLAPKGKYPRVLDYHGQSPPQYPDIDEETGEMSWNPYLHWGS